jgi:hypothetical protein
VDTPSHVRVAARHRVAASLDVPVTLPYLRRLLAYVEAADADDASEWRRSCCPTSAA